jgi:hypothetical protein
MQPLKALVIVMGILIAAGMTVVGYTIVKRASNPEAMSHTRAAAAEPTTVGQPYGPVALALPPGARILRTSTAGRRLIVELELAGGGERILVLELESGALLGTIDLKPQP